jgi:hypothetical protein
MQEVEIRVKGHLDRDWSGRLWGLRITHTSDGNTVLSGPLRDQAQLEGLLSQLFGMGIQLLSVSSDNITPERWKEGKM